MTGSLRDDLLSLPWDTDLTAEEMAKADAFADSIDIKDSNAVMNFGIGLQKKLSSFPDKAMSSVLEGDLGEIEKMLSDLAGELTAFAESGRKKGFKALFGRKKVSDVLKSGYSKIEKSINTVLTELEQHEIRLLKDAEILNRMYVLNLEHFRELTVYITAGKKRLDKATGAELPAMQKRAEESGLREDSEAAKDFAFHCDRFEKKLHDLELTRMIALQTGPQIKMVQKSDTLMADKIQSIIMNTIPLWKNRMILALGLEHASKAAKISKISDDITDEVVKNNEQLILVINDIIDEIKRRNTKTASS